MSGQVTMSAYVMFCGANEVPEQSGLTRSECVAILTETCEIYEVDLILHIHTDSFPTGFLAHNVTDEIFNEAFEIIADRYEGERIEGEYKGKLEDMIDDFNQRHPDTRREQATDRQIDEMRGK